MEPFDRTKDKAIYQKWQFTLFESLLAPKSNPLLAVEELHFAKQGSMTSGEFHSHIVKIAKRCQFPTLKLRKEPLGMQFSWA